MNIGVLVSIGGFAALLVALVYATGNLGAAMGAHLGNNLIGFLFISHENTLSPFALYRGATLADLPWTPGQAIAIVGMSIVSILITLALLLHPRSPLRVEADTGRRSRPHPNLDSCGDFLSTAANSATSRTLRAADRDADALSEPRP